MEYSEKVLEHFKKPSNYGRMKNPDAIGKVGNIVCGDVMWLYIKVGKSTNGRGKGEDFIKDIKFETFGCVAAIASSSVITDLAKGRTLKEALKISKEDVLKSLKGLPPIKVHCSFLSVDALFDAIYNYLKANKKLIPRNLEKNHSKTQKENDLIKEKYKKWIKLEEEIYKTGKI